ncbi:MAG: sporulation protein YqfD [Bacillota bacterium]
MDFGRWWVYFRGYVLITVQGTGVERFINLSLTKGIRLWDIFRLPNDTVIMKVLPAGFFQLRDIARKTRCRVRIKQKYGLPFTIHQLKGRRMLVAGAVFFLAALVYLSSFVWFIEVAPQEPLQYVNPIDIQERAKEKGLYIGAAKRRLDVSLVEKHLENSIPELAWVGIQVEGTRARIKVVEKVLLSPQYQRQEPAHVVAAKDGVIKEILVMIGNPLVKAGDTVVKGQVLISGIIYPQDPSLAQGAPAPPKPQDKAQYRRARGIVRARVWYEAEEIVFLTERQEIPTGRKAMAISLVIGNREIILKRAGRQFANAMPRAEVKTLPGWRNLPAPVEIITTTYHEVEIREKSFTAAEALSIAEARALALIKSQMPASTAIVAQAVKTLPGDKEKVAVKVTVEAVEDIGVVQPFKL